MKDCVRIIDVPAQNFSHMRTLFRRRIVLPLAPFHTASFPSSSLSPPTSSSPSLRCSSNSVDGVRGVDNVSNATGGERRRHRNNNNNNNIFDSDRGVMRVYDSLSSDFRSLPPLSSLSSLGTATYVCGPTVYDSAHLGHGRTYVLLDIMRRVLNRVHEINGNDTSDRRPRPLYVVNITDVDDKIIKRSREDGIADPLDLARYYENEFWEDMDALNVLRPDVICRVSEHVESTIVPYIERIVQGGMAYVIPDAVDDEDVVDKDEQNGGSDERRHPQHWGSVYFDVHAFETRTGGRTRYGKLAPDIVSSSSSTSSSSLSSSFFSWDKNGNEDEKEQIIENPREGGDMVMLVRTRKGKRDSRDFCLWKYRCRTRTTRRKTISEDDNNDEDDVIEPPSVSYLSPWGPGRPGWHVECSAMIERLSRDFCHTHVFGMHAGGVDLKFPHHTNEIAQAEAYHYATTTSTMPIDAVGADPVDDNSVGNDNEWINHWVHTGHLYVKGRKMSKSLKNFVTIREMLSSGTDDGLYQQSRNDACHSPSDDFRLWCLGLSGSYRGPATFNSDRMAEARNIRMEWVHFLMEGQECLARLQKLSDTVNDCGGDAIIERNHKASSTRLWGDEELQLFHSITGSDIACRKALLDDLNGTLFVREISRIVETGLAYVEGAGRNNDVGNDRNRPEEPLRFVLDTLRDLLGLVGFTPRTVNAGLSISLSTNNANQQSHEGVGSNTVLIDEVVAFRSAVRSAALGVIRKKSEEGDSSGLDAAKKILFLCDDLRDDILPKFGLEVLDNKVSIEDESNLASRRGWRHCSPRDSATTNKR